MSTNAVLIDEKSKRIVEEQLVQLQMIINTFWKHLATIVFLSLLVAIAVSMPVAGAAVSLGFHVPTEILSRDICETEYARMFSLVASCFSPFVIGSFVIQFHRQKKRSAALAAAFRNDLSKGVVEIERHTVQSAVMFREPEHGVIVYLVRTSEESVIAITKQSVI